MQKLVLVAVAVAALGGLVAWFVSVEDGTSTVATAPQAAQQVETPDAAATAEKAKDAPKKQRSRAVEETPKLAVSGVVRACGGPPVAGAVVEAFAVPAGEDVPDEERVGRAMLTKLFGKAGGDRLWAKTKKLQKAGANSDPADMADAAQAGIDAAMDMLQDDGGLSAFGSIGQLMTQAQFEDDGAWTKVGACATDGEGRFRVEGLAAGRVELRAKAPGHVKTKKRVDAGASDVAIDLVRGARLTGVVTRNKEPVVGATLVIKGDKTTSGAGGRFEFDAAHVPQETLLASAKGCVSQSRTLTLSHDGATKEIEVALEPAGAVAGHVSALGGGLIAGARVSIAPSGNPFMAMIPTGGDGGATSLPASPVATDANGAFEMQGVRAGPVKLFVEADGYLASTVSVDVKADETATVEAPLVRESTMVGTVKDESGAPVAGARVRVEVPARDGGMGMVASLLGGTFKSAVADERGVYEVHGLVEGERKVRVNAAKLLDIEEKVRIPAQGAAARDFVMRPGFKLAGSVAGPDGKPFAGAKIYVTGKPSASAGIGAITAMFGGGSKDAAAESGADGKWAVDGLQEGPYDVKASSAAFLDAELKGVAHGRTDVALTLGAAATIRGVVSSISDNKPVAGATVKRVSADGAKKKGGRGAFAAMFGGRGGASETCDAEGAFEMTGLEPGEYELTATMRGHADSATTKVAVAAGETFDGVVLLLQPGVSISGRVVEKSTGAAVSGAVVWASTSDNPFAGMSPSDVSGGAPAAPAGAISATSDADGRFVLEGLNPGKTMIEVRAADHAPTSISGVVAPTADVVAEVAAGGSVEGRVTGASGDPVPDAQVMVMKGMMGQGMRQSKTDGDGRYRIERVAAGTYTVMLVDMDNPMAPTMASVTVKDGETARHDFAKKSGGGKKVGGGVLKDGKPLSGAMVMLMGGNVGMKMATSDDAGRFGFDGLPPGEYTVLVQSSVMGGGATSKKVTVGADGKVEDVQLELSSAKIEGDVIDAETGEGVALAQITLTEPGTKLSSANDMIGGVRGQGFTDDRGHFVISDVQSGAFTLRVASGDYVPSVLDGVPAGSTGLKIRMHRGVEFQVTVQDADGRGVPNASVKSVDSSGRENMALDMTMSGFTRADGVATLRLVPGRYGLDVSAENMLPAHVDVDTTAGPATVTLSAGATLELAVVDADGAVVVGAKVVVKDSAGKEIARGLVLSGFLGGGDATDANGRYSRGGLPSGAVSVVVTVAGKDPTTVEATLEANKTKRVDVSIK